MGNNELPPEFIEALKGITGKRAKIVVNHILEHGFISTEDLESHYGYRHPPRAIRDVREQGIPIDTFNITASDGRTIGAYRFGNPSELRAGQLGGRRNFPKKLKDQLLHQQNHKCAICQHQYDQRFLQIDHRIPYEVIGETKNFDSINFMLVCRSCNRSKSWVCEHCPNSLEKKNPDICLVCYWAHPENYEHIATHELRRLDLVWTDEETAIYDKLLMNAQKANENIAEYVKRILKNSVAK